MNFDNYDLYGAVDDESMITNPGIDNQQVDMQIMSDNVPMNNGGYVNGGASNGSSIMTTVDTWIAKIFAAKRRQDVENIKKWIMAILSIILLVIVLAIIFGIWKKHSRKNINISVPEVKQFGGCGGSFSF